MGNYPYWEGRIRPFYDRLDIEVPVVFYQVPETNPLLGPTVFTDRFWDDRDGWVNTGVGTVSKSLRVHQGERPVSCGEIDCNMADFITGISYARWEAGEYRSRQHGCCYPPTIAGGVLLGGGTLGNPGLGGVLLGGGSVDVDASGGVLLGGGTLGNPGLGGVLLGGGSVDVDASGGVLLGGGSVDVDASGGVLLGGGSVDVDASGGVLLGGGGEPEVGP